MLQGPFASRKEYPTIQLKINVQQGFPWQPGIQPVSRGWIGLDTRVCRGETPIRQVNEKYITKNKKITNFAPSLVYSLETPCYSLITSPGATSRHPGQDSVPRLSATIYVCCAIGLTSTLWDLARTSMVRR